MKKILGLDLGVSSIGWALVEYDSDSTKKIIDLGVKIVPLSPDDKTEFEQGNAITKNQKRSVKKTIRRGLDRYQLRRAALIKLLKEKEMMPSKAEVLEITPLALWESRARAATEKVSLTELGRVWLHLNQRRGYQSLGKDEDNDKELGDYLKQVTGRHQLILEQGITTGQYFARNLKADMYYRIREQVFPRAAYKEEFDAIWNTQSQHYPELLTEGLKKKVKDEIIYYQRNLKSKKDQVSFCDFEIASRQTPEGKTILAGPRVAPRSSPLFQVCKLWESINTLEIRNKRNYAETFQPTQEQKQAIFKVLDNEGLIKQPKLFEILGISRQQGYYTQQNVTQKGIQGNLTKAEFIKVLGANHPALQFDLKLTNRVDTQTGEELQDALVDAGFENQPLYRLWHIAYSIKDKKDCARKLVSEFGISEKQALQIASLDLTKAGFSNKSAKAIRKILPHLIKGDVYSVACEKAGYNHSNSITKAENEERVLKPALTLLGKNSLRQPIVEKILNQMIQVVNALIAKHSLNDGKPENELSEVRIELARELKQSKEERNKAYIGINKAERLKKDYEKMLLEHEHFQKKSVSKRDLERYRLWLEMGGVSPYEPQKLISISELFSGAYDIEHILPRSLHFDNSFSNKTLCKREYNSGEFAKNKHTAFDYMRLKRSEADLEAYLNLTEELYKNGKISKTKYENLRRSESQIPKDFIARQLNETRYITRKATELLKEVSRSQVLTIGSITDKLKEVWGWNDVLQDLNLPKYREAGLTEWKEFIINGQVHKKEVIKDWTKRADHRHHAIDALVVAFTGRGIVQRINTLYSEEGRQQMFEEVKNESFKDKLSLLDKHLIMKKPLSTKVVSEKAAETLISYKTGKKVASLSVRKVKKGGKKQIVQRGIIEPRGPLSEETVYGKIKRKIIREVKLGPDFNQVNDIVNPAVKEAVLERLSRFGNNPKEAFRDLKKNPISNAEQPDQPLLKVAIKDYAEEYVVRYSVSSITPKDLPNVVDQGVARALSDHFDKFGGDPKKAFKDLNAYPVWLNKEKGIKVKSVRCYTGLAAASIAPIKVFDTGWDLHFEKYVKPGNNHHVAIYQDADGKLQEHVATFWHTVERKKFGFPSVIENPKEVWDRILTRSDEDQLPESFLECLPKDDWTYVTSMQQNELFVWGLTKEEIEKALAEKDYKTLAPLIFRVRKLTKGSYWLNQQYETEPRESLTDKKAGRCIQASLGSFRGIKVRVSVLGELRLV